MSEPRGNGRGGAKLGGAAPPALPDTVGELEAFISDLERALSNARRKLGRLRRKP